MASPEGATDDYEKNNKRSLDPNAREKQIKKKRKSFPEVLWNLVEDVDDTNFRWKEPGFDGIIVQDRHRVHKYNCFRRSMYDWGFVKVRTKNNTPTDHWYHREHLFRKDDANNDFQLLKSMVYKKDKKAQFASSFTGKQTASPPKEERKADSDDSRFEIENTARKASIPTTKVQKQSAAWNGGSDPLTDREYQEMIHAWFDAPVCDKPWDDYIDDVCDAPCGDDVHDDTSVGSIEQILLLDQDKDIEYADMKALVEGDEKESRSASCELPSKGNELDIMVERFDPDATSLTPENLDENEFSRARMTFWSMLTTVLGAHYRRHAPHSISREQTSTPQVDRDLRAAAWTFEAFADQLYHVREMTVFTQTSAIRRSGMQNSCNGDTERSSFVESFLQDEFEKNIPLEMKDPSFPEARHLLEANDESYLEFAVQKYRLKKRLQEILDAHHHQRKVDNFEDIAAGVAAIKALAWQLEGLYRISFYGSMDDSRRNYGNGSSDANKDINDDEHDKTDGHNDESGGGDTGGDKQQDRRFDGGDNNELSGGHDSCEDHDASSGVDAMSVNVCNGQSHHELWSKIQSSTSPLSSSRRMEAHNLESAQEGKQHHCSSRDEYGPDLSSPAAAQDNVQEASGDNSDPVTKSFCRSASPSSSERSSIMDGKAHCVLVHGRREAAADDASESVMRTLQNDRDETSGNFEGRPVFPAVASECGGLETQHLRRKRVASARWTSSEPLLLSSPLEVVRQTCGRSLQKEHGTWSSMTTTIRLLVG